MAKIITKEESKGKVTSDRNQQYLEEMLKNLDKRIAEEKLKR
jgi:hypothetical protein